MGWQNALSVHYTRNDDILRYASSSPSSLPGFRS